MSATKKFLLGTILIGLLGFAVGINIVPEYYYKLGINAYEKGDYQTAYKNFYNAKLISPSDSDYRYYYVQTLAKFKPSVRIQKEMFKFVEDGKDDSAHVAAGIQVAVWRNNILQQYGENYIEQAPINNQIMRWNPKTFPLKVYVDFADIATVPDYYNNEIFRAFGQWQVSSGFLAFKFIDSPDSADITVKFAPLPKNNCNQTGCKYVVAHTIPTIKNNILKQMTITIYDKDANGSYFSDRQLYNTVLHEIGHALGIMGHSYSTDDLMYMAEDGREENPMLTRYRSDFQYISNKDVSTLKLLYNLIPSVTNTPLDEVNTENLIYPPIVLGTTKNMSQQKLKEAQKYVQEAPDIPNGYIDMAIAYDELGKFDLAVQALQNAFNKAQTDMDKYIVLYNYAVLYLNNNNPETAMQYAKQAKQIGDSEELFDLMSNIEHAIETKSSPFKGTKLLR